MRRIGTLLAITLLILAAPVSASASARTVWFSGIRWEVREGAHPSGPGPNRFSDSRHDVWVDGARRLHLRIDRRSGHWYCAELTSADAFGYGTYVFHITGRPGDLNPNVVLGLFTWDNAPTSHHREIDIELSRWGALHEANAQFVVQPYRTPSNIHRFDIRGQRRRTTEAFAWTNGRVEFWSLWGNHDPAAQTDGVIDHWVNAGPDVPTPGDAHVHINLWLQGGHAPSDGRPAQIVISGFSFTPSP